MNKNEKRKTADICLKRGGNYVPLVEELTDLTEVPLRVYVEIEVRAWVCPFCNTSEEYILVNGCCLIGLGGATLISKDKKSDCCSNAICKMKQDKFHDSEIKGA